MAEFTSYAHGTPCWVDVTSTDMDRTVAFYGALFGWEAETAPAPEAGGYTMFTLRGKNVAAASPPPPSGPQASYWTTYLASDDVDDTAAKVRDAGGTVFLDPFDVFDAGRMTVAQDPTGAAFGVWQANRHIGAQLANEPGTLNWNECQTRDPDAAARFYEAVFGVEVEQRPMAKSDSTYGVINVGGRGVAGILRLPPELADVPPNWSPVFTVASIEDTLSRAPELGGAVLMGPMDIPGVGRLGVIQDPAGAVFQVLEG
jgi:predicted enzyme related to lactoylglutathione lyase